MTLAIFDLDNTLIAGDSDHAWGEFLVERKLVDPEFYAQKNDQFYRDYQQGCLDIFTYLEFCLAFLSTKPINELQQIRQEFLEEKIKPIRLASAFDLVNQHREKGHTLLVITSTNRFVCEPIVKWFDIPHLIATEPEFKAGRYTGKVFGIPSYKEGKVKRLHAWLDQNLETITGSFGYSDSHNDIPLLNMVDHPIVVDGESELTAHAKAHHWACISLRNER